MLSFHVKLVQIDGRTTVKQYAPDILIREHKRQFPDYEHFLLFQQSLQKASLTWSLTVAMVWLKVNRQWQSYHKNQRSPI